MASLQHAVGQAGCRRAPGRQLQPCSAEKAPIPQQQPPATTRRRALGAALLLPAAAGALALAPRPALAAEQLAAAAPAAADLAAEAAAPPPVLDVISWPQWVDRNFSFSYPPGFQEQDPSFAALPRRPGASPDQVQENPLKAAVRSADNEQRIDVVVRQSTAVKRTLFQVTDISQLGDVRQVAKLLLPPGATVLGSQTVTVAQPPKDTGTVLGVIERDPVNYYSYEVVLPDKSHLQLTAAAQLGRVYALAASAPDGRWGECGPALREAALSFRLRYKI